MSAFNILYSFILSLDLLGYKAMNFGAPSEIWTFRAVILNCFWFLFSFKFFFAVIRKKFYFYLHPTTSVAPLFISCSSFRLTWPQLLIWTHLKTYMSEWDFYQQGLKYADCISCRGIRSLSRSPKKACSGALGSMEYITPRLTLLGSYLWLQ